MGKYRPIHVGQFTLGTLDGRPVATWDESGNRRRFRLGPEGLDQKSAEALLHQFARARTRAAEPSKRVTVQAIFDAYIADKALDHKPTTNQTNHWKALSPVFAHLAPADITKAVCKNYERTRTAAGRKMGTVWSELVALRSVLNWAAKAGMIPAAPHVTIPPKPSPRDVSLTREELATLLDATEPHHLKLYIILAITTAGRMGAILQLTWDRIDFQNGTINLHDPGRKATNKGRAFVPMNASARAALSEAKPAALTDYVVEWNAEPVASVKKGLATAAASVGLKCSPHVLRHSAARWMAEAGVPMEEIASYLGHSTTAITYRVYAKYSPTYLRKAASALELPAARPVTKRSRVR